jgi:small-conductance mechanosensitive channel
MPDFDFNFELSALATGAVKVLVIVLVVLVVLWVLRRAIRRIIRAKIPKLREESQEQLASRSETLSGVITRVMSFVVWIIAFMMILSVLGINTAPILAAVGLAGLAIGFAAQNIIRDYFHGFFIIMEDWFRIGEVATLAGVGGLVEGMGLRRTVLRDINGTMHVIPNGKIELASNMTRDWARINLDVAVAYKENLETVFNVINDVGQQLKDDPTWGADLLTSPHAERVNDLGDNGIAIKVLADTKPMRQWALTGELRKRLKERFDSEGIEIPWPHTKVYFGNTLAGSESLN